MMPQLGQVLAVLAGGGGSLSRLLTPCLLSLCPVTLESGLGTRSLAEEAGNQGCQVGQAMSCRLK